MNNTAKKTVVLKLTGEAFLNKENKPAVDLLESIAEQIKTLKDSTNFALVVGGGNIFRGDIQGKVFRLNPSNAHYAGMLATVINGIVIKNIFENNGISCALLSAINCPEIADYINQNVIDDSLRDAKTLIFAGGVGNPFFTTDTNSILRALQVKADEVWKATKVNGLYDKDPYKFEDAKKIEMASHDDVLNRGLQVMDQTAFSLAKENKVKIRIFDVFEKDALIKAAQNKDFGSIIY